MEGSKHTPGKWKVDSSTEYTSRVNIGREHNNKLLEFALVSGENHKENAKLIASAPALLEENERLKHENYYDDQVHKIEVDRLMKELSESKSLVSDHWEVINGLIKEKTELMGVLKSLHDLSEEYMSDSELWAPFIEQAKYLLTRIK